jgi:acyl-CoA hydrolase
MQDCVRAVTTPRVGLVTLDARHPAATRSELTYCTGVRDANAAGDVHGGWIMKLSDEVAGIAACRHARRRVVTAAVDGMRFRHPVRLHDVVTLKATVNAAWRTSMEVGVHVEAQDVISGESRHTLTAYLTFVALDDEGRPVPIPPLVPQTPKDRQRWRDANLRRTIRLAGRDRLHELHQPLEAADPERATTSNGHRNGGS